MEKNGNKLKKNLEIELIIKSKIDIMADLKYSTKISLSNKEGKILINTKNLTLLLPHYLLPVLWKR